MEDCVFCKIVSGEIPSQKIYEDEETLAFLDIQPVNPGHTVVIPKKHYTNIFDTPEELWLHVMKTAHMLAPAIKKGVNAVGVNITNNNEAKAGQTIFHTHVHVIPRVEGDGHKLWPQQPYPEGEANAVADAIRAKLRN